jgi:hypothetical protein
MEVTNMEEERKPIKVKPKITDSNMNLRKPLLEPRDSTLESGTSIRRPENQASVIPRAVPQRELAPSRFSGKPASLLKLTLSLVAALSGALTIAVLVTVHYAYTLPSALPMTLVCIVEALNIVLIVMLWMVASNEL